MCADSNTAFRAVWRDDYLLIKGEYKMSKRCLFLSALGVTLALCASAPFSHAQGKKAINVSSNKSLPFSDGIIAGNTLYVAGQEGIDDSGKLAVGGIVPETKTALDNIEKVLKAAGYDMKDLVSVTVFLADIKDFPEMNKVYKSMVPEPRPVRATVQAAALVGDAKVEIAAIAVKQK